MLQARKPWIGGPYLHLFDHVIFGPRTGCGLGTESPSEDLCCSYALKR